MIIVGDGIVLGAGGESASIVVTAPTGSTVTCATPSGIVLTAAEVGGTWTFTKLKSYGTYTIVATDGTKTATSDVVVDSASEHMVELVYGLKLYWDGDECTDVTGGWTNSGYTYGGNSNGAITKNSNSMYATTHSGNSIAAGIVNAVDVTNYSTLFAEVMRTDSANLYQPWVGIGSNKSLSDKLVTPYTSAANVKETLSIDITSLTGNKYVAFVHSNGSQSGSGYAYKIWLE